MFKMSWQRIQAYKFKDSNIKPLMELLTSIYALHEIRKDNQMLYETGYFGQGSNSLLNEAYNMLLRGLRPHIIPLVEGSEENIQQEDSWNISTIGNKYGDIYETQLEVSKNSRLNTGKAPACYESLMKPIIKGGHAKL